MSLCMVLLRSFAHLRAFVAVLRRLSMVVAIFPHFRVLLPLCFLILHILLRFQTRHGKLYLRSTNPRTAIMIVAYIFCRV